ncbi:MAG: hypothetical protein K2H28_01460 [Ruminococcus sp.]|nr:hypothetical protein [Ruminococcus sp.]
MSFCIDSEKNNGYPCIEGLPEMPSADMKKKYPYGYMVCTDGKNNGYPYIRELNSISVEKFSVLYFGGKLISEMYYDGNFISCAYFNEKEVFRIKYIRS